MKLHAIDTLTPAERDIVASVGRDICQAERPPRTMLQMFFETSEAGLNWLVDDVRKTVAREWPGLAQHLDELQDYEVLTLLIEEEQI